MALDAKFILDSRAQLALLSNGMTHGLLGGLTSIQLRMMEGFATHGTGLHKNRRFTVEEAHLHMIPCLGHREAAALTKKLRSWLDSAPTALTMALQKVILAETEKNKGRTYLALEALLAQ